MPITEIANELHLLGEHGAEWPKATVEHWIRDLKKLANEGQLTIDEHGMVWVPIGGDKPKQMTLF
jgi:hypothetical protein